MIPRDNYQIQVRQAQARFLTYDQEVIIEKFGLCADESFLHTAMLSLPYRICRKTGGFQRQEQGIWVDANSHGEVMTLLDILCDARQDRHPAGKYQTMNHFGRSFHRNLLEDGPDPLAARFDRDPDALHRACAALKGERLPQGDIGYALPFFQELRLAVHFWHGDEEFAPRLRFLWDANALMYLRYETMHFALGLLRRRLGQ